MLLCSLKLVWFSTIGFSQLMECKIILVDELDLLEPLILLLQNSTKLKVLLIDKVSTFIHSNFYYGLKKSKWVSQYYYPLWLLHNIHWTWGGVATFMEPSTNQGLFPKVCQPISRSLSRKNTKKETKRNNFHKLHLCQLEVFKDIWILFEINQQP